MNHFDEKPYIEKIETIGPFEVWLVDPTWICRFIEREFTNFAQPLNPRFKGKIPPREFWIAQGVDPMEIDLFIDHMMVEYELMKRGWSYKTAEAEAIRIEQRERARGSGPFFEAKKQLDLKAERKLIEAAGELKIFLVDGKLVRVTDPRFCSGGHSRVYPAYVPDHHVWIDDTSPQREWNYFILHEVNEFFEMEDLPYPTAHKHSSRLEYGCRWNSLKLITEMAKLGLTPLRHRKKL